jgi:hypothetical protein
VTTARGATPAQERGGELSPYLISPPERRAVRPAPSTIPNSPYLSAILVRVPFFATSTVQRFPNFPRNFAPDSTHYLSERIEMIFSQGEVTEGHNKQNQIKQRNKR